MAKKVKNYGIKFPFTLENNDEVFLDLDKDFIAKAKSDMLHTIFTPKGQRYRMPSYGTRLIDYIFSDNTDTTMSPVHDEIMTAIELYVPSVTIKDIKIYKSDDDDHRVFVTIKYVVSDGVKTTSVLEENIEL